MKFLLDANMPISTLRLFKNLNLEPLHAKQVGLKYAEDNKVFDYAINNNCILITKDLEFGNPNIFNLKFCAGLIILRLPFYFTATQINKYLENFLNSININELENKITVLKLGAFRMKEIK